MYAAALPSALALVAASGAGAPAAPGWSRARSAHFEVLTDAGEPLARHAALRLETLRGVLLQLFPPRTSGERRLVAILLASGSAFEQLVPRRHQQPHQVAGFYQGCGEWDAIVARLSTERRGPFASLDHEYAHIVLNRSLPAQPLWAAEGLAELLSDGEFDGSEALLGAAEPGLEPSVRGRRAEPLAKLLLARHDSPEYLGASRGLRLYPSSWALVRWVVARHGLAGLRALLEAVSLGQDPLAAFDGRWPRSRPPRRRCWRCRAARSCAWRSGRGRRDSGFPRSWTRRAAPSSSTGWASCCCERASSPAVSPGWSGRSPSSPTASRCGSASRSCGCRAASRRWRAASSSARSPPRPTTRARCSTTLACALAESRTAGVPLHAGARRAPRLPAGAGARPRARPLRGGALARRAAPAAVRAAPQDARAGVRAGSGAHRGGARDRGLDLKERDLAAAERVLRRAREAATEPAYRFLCERAARRHRGVPVRDGGGARAADPRRMPSRREPPFHRGRAARAAAARGRLAAQLHGVRRRAKRAASPSSTADSRTDRSSFATRGSTLPKAACRAGCCGCRCRPRCAGSPRRRAGQAEGGAAPAVALGCALFGRSADASS